MNFKMLFPFVLAASIVSTIGCATATVNVDNVCATATLPSIPAAPVLPAGQSYPSATFSRSIPFDFSQTLSKVDSAANSLNVSVNQLLLSNTTGDLTWVSEILVSINNQDSSSDSEPLASFHNDGTESNDVQMQVDMDSTTLLTYLSAGPVELTFSITGTVPTTPTTLSNTMCVSVAASVSKGI